MLPLLLALPGATRADTAPSDRLVAPLALPTPSKTTAAPAPPAPDDRPSLLAPEIKAPATEAAGREIRHEVARGDTLATIFSRHGLSDATLMALLENAPDARSLAHLQPGDILTLRLSPDRRRLEHVMLERRRGTAQAFDLPATARQQKNPAAAPPPATKTREIVHRIRRGETLAGIFKRLGIPAATLQRVLDEDRHKARALARIRPGQRLRLLVTRRAGRLLRLTLEGGDEPLVVALDSKGKTVAEPPPAAPAPAVPVAPPRPSSPAPAAMTQTTENTVEPPQTRIAEVAETAAPITLEHASPREIVHRVHRGETLAAIFKKYGLGPSVVHQVLHAGKPAKALSRIRPGQELRFELTPDGQLQRLTFTRSPIERLLVAQADTGYRVRLDKKKVEHRIATVAGTIHSSLFVDGQKAGLTDRQIMELAEIFGWDIDFALEIRAGDQFRVVFDEQLVDGEKYANGPILAAEFVNRGKTYTAFRFEHDGEVGYYDAQGHSKRRAFIRTPIRFARISSRFTRKRWHPVLKKWRSHKGVDYAAPKGTPIKATGDGKVVFRGWKRGYGRVVMIQHGHKYQTVYAHMSRFRRSVRAGSHVRQGQVIGYVGQSGLATGPHLHYEFRVNGRHRNPLTVKLPRSLSLPRRQLTVFKQQTAPLAQQLASLRAKSMVAKNDL
ncbi:peptidoglycan DD-metalloendopeptidase family protein [endosymbiont of unidentified scaly snail isolate Monju]|uniref:peptidoglycan DD-metalloendopeptidase family protein n=1 Tax=endosymbiont of unidentified scaly snail isolate Monju TaxID=1248727 RepID=UPI0003892839|nr:peptidoglycan DD-metalloendopeptidase family protein [endosymbiont of unidentified scaly snail isolate Monju]BAN69894.1 peptidase M23B [endosymbiont of unidentified scaly snail isolate Monju]